MWLFKMQKLLSWCILLQFLNFFLNKSNSHHYNIMQTKFCYFLQEQTFIIEHPKHPVFSFYAENFSKFCISQYWCLPLFHLLHTHTGEAPDAVCVWDKANLFIRDLKIERITYSVFTQYHSITFTCQSFRRLINLSIEYHNPHMYQLRQQISILAKEPLIYH